MLDFGEELTIEAYKIPWLIWVQILVLLLLMILLYCFSIFPLDPSSENNTGDNNNNHFNALASSSSAAPSFMISHEKTHMQKRVLKPNTTLRNRLQPSQIGGAQRIKGEIATKNTISRRIVIRGEENITERKSTSPKEANSNNLHHPCHYFRLASLAFLKCLGLDPSSENSSSSTTERRKDR